MEIKEEWKSLPEYVGVEVSTLGRVRKNTRKHHNDIISEFCKDRDGYCRCTVFFHDGRKTSEPVHRLVAKAFIPNPEHKTCVNHIDNDRTNNRVDNLEWVTPKENVYHSYLHGNRKKLKNVQRTTVLTDFQVSQIDKLRTLYTVNQISKLFNIKYTTLKNIIRRDKRRLDNQQPSIYKDIYEGSTTIPDGSKTQVSLKCLAQQNADEDIV